MSLKKQMIKLTEKKLLPVRARRLGIRQGKTEKFAKTFWNEDILY